MSCYTIAITKRRELRALRIHNIRETIVLLCMILLHSMKKFAIVHHLFPYDLENASKSQHRVLTLTAQTYTKSLLNDDNAPDGRS